MYERVYNNLSQEVKSKLQEVLSHKSSQYFSDIFDYKVLTNPALATFNSVVIVLEEEIRNKCTPLAFAVVSQNQKYEETFFIQYYAISLEIDSTLKINFRMIVSSLFHSIRKHFKNQLLYSYVHRSNERLFYLLEHLGMKITYANFPDSTIENLMSNDDIPDIYKDSQWCCFWFPLESIVDDHNIIATTVIYFDPQDDLREEFTPPYLSSITDALKEICGAKIDILYETNCERDELYRFITLQAESGTDIIRICHADKSYYSGLQEGIKQNCKFKAQFQNRKTDTFLEFVILTELNASFSHK